MHGNDGKGRGEHRSHEDVRGGRREGWRHCDVHDHGGEQGQRDGERPGADGHPGRHQSGCTGQDDDRAGREGNCYSDLHGAAEGRRRRQDR